MVPVDQSILPEEGPRKGNCLTACIASLLDLPIEQVPNFVESSRWYDALNQWLAPRGLFYLEVRGAEPAAAQSLCAYAGWHTITGLAPSGIRHTVVGYAGEVRHDPHPSRAGLISSDTCGFVIPLNPALWIGAQEGTPRVMASRTAGSNSLIVRNPGDKTVLYPLRIHSVAIIAEGAAAEKHVRPAPQGLRRRAYYAGPVGKAAFLQITGVSSLIALEKRYPQFTRANNGVLINPGAIKEFVESFGELESVRLRATPEADLVSVMLSEREAVALKQLFPNYPRARAAKSTVKRAVKHAAKRAVKRAAKEAIRTLLAPEASDDAAGGPMPQSLDVERRTPAKPGRHRRETGIRKPIPEHAE
jgi:hypothetical protein